jgi:multidrug/hemolysin transport system permease protein
MTVLAVAKAFVLCNTSLILFVVSFFKSTNAFATASTVIGTMIGFLTGIYLPVGQLPNAVQWVVKVFPVSHAAAMLRQVMMAVPMAQTFAGVPAEASSQFSEMMGVTFKFGNTSVSDPVSVLILVCSAVLFFALSVLSLSRKKK